MSSEPTATSVKPEWIMPIESRKARADFYFLIVLENQREWYSAKAGTQKRRHLFFAISVIVLGALISCLQVIETAVWVKYLTASLGASVSVFRAVDALLRPGETWQGYRKASENMKREYRLYINNADVYAEVSGEQAAYRLLVERVETALAEEQQLFWQFHAKNSAQQPSPKQEVGDLESEK
jgi:hypothetical protein